MFRKIRNWWRGGVPTPSDIRWPTLETLETIISRYSPDIGKLEERQAVLLFVCNEMMKRHEHHYMLEEFSAPLCWAFTKEPLTHMIERRSGRGVVTRDKFTTVHHTHVKGELFAVMPYRFRAIDAYMKNGEQFTRQRVKLTVPYRRTSMIGFPLFQEVNAWMYVGVEEHWSPKYDSGLEFIPAPTFSKLDLIPDYSFYPANLKKNE